MLREHCDAVGRDYDEVEKTTMIRMGPDTTTDDIVRTASQMHDLGFTVAYVYARDITEPGLIIDRLAAAIPRLAD